MKSKEALELIEYLLSQDYIGYENSIETIEKDLEILNIFKKYLYIYISDTPVSYNNLYPIWLREKADDESSFIKIFVTEQEKDLLKEMIKQ